MQGERTVANKVANDLYVAKIYWIPEWQEYQVRLYVNGTLIRSATYHTEWQDDAISTAFAMVKLPPQR